MRTLISRYPEFYTSSPQFVDIQQAQDPEVQRMWDARDGIANQLHIGTATWGLRYWEQSLGIPVEVDKEISFRRARVRAKLRGAGTTTVALIQSVAESYSNGAVEVTEHPAQYSIDIKFVGTIGIPPNMDDLTTSLREIMPAHLHWDYIIVYNTWDKVKPHTWGTLISHVWADLKEHDL